MSSARNGGPRLQADLDLYKLEVFYWVAELRSFSQAADLLSLTQPTVSAHVQELEEIVGGKLLFRISGKVSLTSLGQMLAERAKDLLAFKRATRAALEHFHGMLTGELWVGGSNIPGEYLLPHKLGAFTKKFPGVKPILRIRDSAGIIEDVLDGKVELGFIGFKRDDNRLTFEQIWKDEMVVAVSRDHPWSRKKTISISDLSAEKFISRERGSGTADSLRQLLVKRRQSPDRLLNITMELGSTEAVKQAILAGFGVSILSRVSIKREVREGSIVEIAIRGLTLKRDFYTVFHSRRQLHPTAQAFRQFLNQ
jgi:LysR family transcriptional regulator, low CO2-responsive transcriptional regulator